MAKPLLWYYYIEIKRLSLFVWDVYIIWVNIMQQGGIWTGRLFHIWGVFVVIWKGNKWTFKRMLFVVGRMYVTLRSWILSSWVYVSQLGGKNVDIKDSLCEEVKHFSQINPTRCTILLIFLFIFLLYMFWVSTRPSPGENCCIYATLALVTLKGGSFKNTK